MGHMAFLYRMSSFPSPEKEIESSQVRELTSEISLQNVSEFQANDLTSGALFQQELKHLFKESAETELQCTMAQFIALPTIQKLNPNRFPVKYLAKRKVDLL
ncbi:hypothetical protein TNIN_260601 [Trichonephila inaurata madagascariensis]|uniref:Uncharacterized protein n=1 Tax=Trichonephila inaurata madagascariensis TaxID=2747483 RepID=A0A8X6Y5U3_9ARAC|nr:hypothetical protein TNIN_260601 [Trichonephila inaurata madagascariensis]